VFLFKPGANVPPDKVIQLKGLNPAGRYALTFQDWHDLDGVRTGAQLITDGIHVKGMTGAHASGIIWIAAY
jgi:hypothetical protein